MVTMGTTGLRFLPGGVLTPGRREGAGRTDVPMSGRRKTAEDAHERRESGAGDVKRSQG
jgi:hypothetical protein